MSNNIKRKLLQAVKRRQRNVMTNIRIQKNFFSKNRKINAIYDEHVGGYTDDMNYREINKYMYGGYVEFDTEDYVIPDINGMFKVFEAIPKLTADITVFRVTDYKINRKTLRNKKELFIPAFTSTTYQLEFEKSITGTQNIIDVIVPRGSKGIIAADSKFYEEEREIILPPGYYELINETTKELRSGMKVNFYKIKLKKQILTVKDWLEHLKLNNKKIEDQDYFEEQIEELNEPVKSVKKLSIKKPSPAKKPMIKPTKTTNTKIVIKKKKKVLKVNRKPIKIKKRRLKKSS